MTNATFDKLRRTNIQEVPLNTCIRLAIFLAVVAVVVSMKFRLKIAGRGPHAHIPCPGLCWCRGPRWCHDHRLPAGCHETLSGPPLWLPRAACTLPLPGRRIRAASLWDSFSTGSKAGLLRTFSSSRPAWVLSCSSSASSWGWSSKAAVVSASATCGVPRGERGTSTTVGLQSLAT